MIDHLEIKNVNGLEKNVDPRYTAKGRFDAMKSKMKRNVNKYPDMSLSPIDYSDPSDLPEIFFKREWNWFEQILGNTWGDWSNKFSIINDVRNLKSHNNPVPKAHIELAKKYCHEINEKIEMYLNKK